MTTSVQCCLLAATLVMGLAAQKPAVPAPPLPVEDPLLAADIQGFTAWLQNYRTGAIRFAKADTTDEAALARLDAQMGKLAQWNTLAAARLLFEAASIEPSPPGAASSVELVDFQRELQPWRVQTMACNHLRVMTGDGILPWLLQMLNAPGVRAVKKNQDQQNAAAVLRTLGGHQSVEAQLELLRAARSMPTELRVFAVNALARDATVESVPQLIELLRDPEPNVRIAAVNAMGAAMQPHVDESLGKQPTGDLLALRDQVIQRLEDLLVRDAIWQVRSAAAFSLAIQKCKPVVPAIIHGLEAELNRKKDPWAMDLRLHKILEGLTGKSVLQGDIALWKQFWALEGPSFLVKPQSKPGEEKHLAAKYGKFFDLQIESDRVLFVLDFSGSMAETVQLATKATGVAASGVTTKAALVVAELKKLIMSLPDGALLNLIVFSDDVRCWRQEGGRPSLVKLDDNVRDDLLGSFLDGLRPNGPTNLYDAMDKALDFGGRGLHDKYYAAGFDTLYVITDGAPTAGAVVDKNEIRRRVRETNQLRKIAIHCITFGDKNDTDFLKPLAEENGGRHIHVE